MKYDVLLKRITYLLAEMISAGGSGELVVRKMKSVCSAYGLSEAEFIVNTGGVFATALAPDGTELTAIRAIDGIGQNFERLQMLDEYCEAIPENLPDAEEIDREIKRILGAKGISRAAEYLASIVLGTGFAVLFGCGLADAFIAAAACILIVFLGSILRKFSTNQFFSNAVVCLAMTSLVLSANVFFGICRHPERVILGVIMLLISGLSFSDGLWSMINKDITIGIYKLNNAVIGAIGIVAGVATPLLLIENASVGGLSISSPVPVQVLLCVFACGGFAVLCCTQTKHIPAAALGAGLSWLVYAVLSKLTPSLFISMAAATFAVTIYAVFVREKWGLNPNITRVVGILPLVPGTNLFYMLYAVVSKNTESASAEGTKLITACLGISFGFTLGRLILEIREKKIREKERKQEETNA